jgi:hypothetical protein
LVLLAVLAGCGAAPTGGGSSDGTSSAVATLEETRPFVGRVKEVGNPDQELGDFVLAYCGCTCWRALFIHDDGSVRTQLLVHFDPEGDGEATSEVVMEGKAEGGLVSGIVDQSAGLTEGRAVIGPYAMTFAADRNQQEIEQIDTCIMCHFGERPVWTLPTSHPEYLLDPPNCLSCHPLEN